MRRLPLHHPSLSRSVMIAASPSSTQPGARNQPVLATAAGPMAALTTVHNSSRAINCEQAESHMILFALRESQHGRHINAILRICK